MEITDDMAEILSQIGYMSSTDQTFSSCRNICTFMQVHCVICVLPLWSSPHVSVLHPAKIDDALCGSVHGCYGILPPQVMIRYF